METMNTGISDTNILDTGLPSTLPESIFRAYDIRGVVGDSLTPAVVYHIGRAIGSAAAAEGDTTVVVGADGRVSSPEMSDALIQGLRDSGREVLDIGMVPTPVLYYGIAILDSNTGVMVTGSHNPADYNGFKIVINGKTLYGDDIQALLTRIKNQDYSKGNGSLQKVSVSSDYLNRISSDIKLDRPMKVVVDCGNGVAGNLAPQMLKTLGCDVTELFCEIDGTFPNHHPDPGKPENLVDLIKTVKAEGADLGLAFDGDGDRVGVVTSSGKMVYPDRLLMLFALDVIKRNPGAEIIYDVKCTRLLQPLLQKAGGKPCMWKTGHSLIKARMKETGALLAGEMSGHIFFKERWYGFDDGLYSAARLLEILAAEERNADQIFDSFPEDISTPEINITVTDESKFKIVEQLQKGEYPGGNASTIDGIRVDYPDGWGLIRASNTTPVLVLRFEAETQEALDRIRDQFQLRLQEVDKDLTIPTT
ncbi:phosphomannomutase/phosphoglucomutase [Motiliproteus sp. MSK22-1]|uniref:phosphomannomutase/phosphoglucomutase n=1 Tax=Motiliproteus sp. MSK22-1 TaxID=1897630 RepID=UPI0009F97B6F|nr:phosphomannomutase/phosphoglucomutase [Motiliproteus sp. MSK22-1]